MDRDEPGHTLAIKELRAHRVSRPFGRHQNHIDVSRRRDGFEVNRKAMGKQQGLALG